MHDVSILERDIIQPRKDTREKIRRLVAQKQAEKAALKKPEPQPPPEPEKAKPKGKKERPEPKEPPPPNTARHKFAPMLPPSLIVNRELNGEAKTLYAWMLMQACGNQYCHASQARMQEELGWSLDKIQRCLDKLEDEGFVRNHRDADGHSRDRYELLVRAVGKQVEGDG